ncbi:hypothetical protein MYX04_14115, partial [Nitrospiraceae bacterium AH_259_D15_M11_P09]|nr:hypothetical protein [Nitrospiraceae bacterium AH_259_D15_M11_P09]
MSAMFFVVTLLLYLAGTTCSLTYLLRRSETLAKVALVVTGIGFLSHTGALLARMIEAGHVPLTNFHDAMSFFS